MTDTELISKLSQEGYSEREIRLAKDCFFIGRGSAFLDVMAGRAKKEAGNGKETR